MKKKESHSAGYLARFLIKTWYLLLCLIFAGKCVFSQVNSSAENKVKAVFIFNFTQFTEWPSTAFDGPEDPFIIGIFGDDPFGNYLDETVEGEKFDTHPIQVIRYHNLSDIKRCHILYINTDDPELSKSVLAAVADKNTLTISDALNFNKWGGIVRFFTEDNKIRLQINVKISKTAQLSISSRLLNVAKTN